MLAATKSALDNNEGVRTFGKKLGNMQEQDRELVLRGAAIFNSLCASYHGADGKGLAIGGTTMAAPSLAGSERLAFEEKNTLTRILLHGLTGPVDGKEYSSIMPGMEANDDEWIASVLSYIRYELGGAPPRRPGHIPGMAPAPVDNESGFPVKETSSPVVTPQEVQKLRQQHNGRNKPWTLEELEALSPTEENVQ